MRFPRSLALLLAAGIVAPALRADALSDVRGALQRLAGREPLHAVVTLERSRHSQGRFVNDDFDGSASFRVTLDATSMNVTYERALLSTAADGRQDGGRKGRGMREALEEVQPAPIANAIDSGGMILQMLEGGRLVEQHVEMRDGRPLRLLTLQLPLTAKGQKGDPTAPEITFDRMTIAIGGDGVPVTATRQRKGTAGILFVHVDTTRDESWRFGVAGDHLVALRFEDRSAVSGPGQHGTALSVWSVSNAEVAVAR